MNGVDDGTVHVQLGHTFPYYGGVFTDAWMSSNGFIILYDPTSGYGNPNTSQSWCNTCPWYYSGGPPEGRSNLSYMIAPMWSDFRHHPSVENSGYFYETGEGGTWFEWRNVQEYGTSNLNTFGLQLWPEGSFDFHYANVNVTQHDTWIGFTGDATSQSGNVYNEVNELFYKQASEGGMTTNHVTNFTDAETNFGYAWWGQDGGYDSTGPDCSDPLNDTSCPGYQQTYFDQQCSNDALYDSQCPGYADALLTQECSSDALYDVQCDGYEVAWIEDQCDDDPLFSQSCSGYSAARIQEQQQEQMNHHSGHQDPNYNDGSSGFVDSQSDGQGGPGDPSSQGGYQDPSGQGGPQDQDGFMGFGGPDDSGANMGGDPGGFTGSTAGPENFFEDPQQQEREPQFTQTQERFSEPQTFNEPEPMSEPVVEPQPFNEPAGPMEPERFSEPDPVANMAPERFSEPDPVESMEPERFSEPERVARVEEEPVVEEEAFAEPERPQRERELLPEESNETVADTEISVEAPVKEVLIEEASEIDPAPVKELAVSKQTNIQIAMSVLETEKASAVKRLQESVSNSESVGQDSSSESYDNGPSQTSQSSGNQLAGNGSSRTSGNSGGASTGGGSSQQTQNSGSQSSVAYGIEDQAVAEFYSDENNTANFGDNGQMQQGDGTFEVTDVQGIVDTVQVTSVSAVTDSQQDENASVDFEQETFSTTDAMFDTQVNEAFSTGANISVVLSGARPDFSKFDVKPPTKQQEVATKKVESLAEKMSDAAIQQNIEQIQENVQDSGGFEDQTVAVVLINYVPGFEQYSSQSLKSQNDWYRSKSIYKSNGNVDNTMTLYIMAGQTEQKHKQMVLDQYGR